MHIHMYIHIYIYIHIHIYTHIYVYTHIHTHIHTHIYIPIFYWTDNGTTHRSPMNPTVKKRIDLQVSQQQLKIHTGSTANFLTREDSSRNLPGKFHKDRSVWIRARRWVLQCLCYQFPCTLQLKQWGILNEVKCRLCEKYYKEKNILDPLDTVESVGHISSK